MSDMYVEGVDADVKEQPPVSPFHLPRPTEASEAALRKADDADRRTLLSRLSSVNTAKVYDFLHDNFDLFYMQDKSLADEMTILDANLRSRDAELRKSAGEAARHLAIDSVHHTHLPVRDLDLSHIKIKLANPLDTQHEMNVDAELTRRGIQQYKNGAGHGGAFVGELATHAWGMLASTRHLLHMGASFAGGTADLLKMRRMQRAMVFGAMTLAVLTAPALPGSANMATNIINGENPFSVDTIIHGLRQEACDVSALFPHGIDVARFEQGLKGSGSSSDQHYLAAMTGVKLGASPAALYAISMFETVNFRDTVSNNSSATGPYQMVTSHKLHLLSTYGKKTDTYKNASARIAAGTASPEDRALVGAFDRTIATYRANPHATIARIDSGVQNADERLALTAADQPVLATELMAPYILQVAPEMGIQELEGASPQKFATALAFYYAPQLMGEDGGAFFRHMVKHAPDTRINDSAAIARHYKAFRPGASAERAAYMGRYYASVAGRNPSIFRNANVSFANASTQIANHMATAAARTQARMAPGAPMVQSTVDACNAGNEAEVARNAGIIAAENLRIQNAREQSIYGKAWQDASGFYNRTIPVNVRSSISEMVGSASGVFRSSASTTVAPTVATAATASKPAAGRSMQIEWVDTPAASTQPPVMPARRQPTAAGPAPTR